MAVAPSTLWLAFSLSMCWLQDPRVVAAMVHLLECDTTCLPQQAFRSMRRRAARLPGMWLDRKQISRAKERSKLDNPSAYGNRVMSPATGICSTPRPSFPLFQGFRQVLHRFDVFCHVDAAGGLATCTSITNRMPHVCHVLIPHAPKKWHSAPV